MWLLRSAVTVMFIMLSVHATDNGLMVKFLKGLTFTFTTEHLKSLGDCFCQENNAACVLLYTPVYSLHRIQGDNVHSQCQKTAFYDCHFYVGKIVNLTCTRTIPSTNTSECNNCHRTCFTNTPSCDVSIIFHFQRTVSKVQINGLDILQHDCQCRTSEAQESLNASSHATATTWRYLLVCLGMYLCNTCNVLDSLI